MQNLRSLRQRIRSVQNTQKITKAMQMVAGAKLRRSLEELLSFRPYAEALGQVTQRFLSAHPGLQHPLLGSDPKEAKGVRPLSTQKGLTPKGQKGSDPFAPEGLVIITSDTGLCGTYNEKVLSAAARFRMEFPSAVVVAIGKKGTRSLSSHGGPCPAKEIITWGGRYDPAEAGKLLGWLESEYLEGKVSSWNIASTRFLSALSWKPVVERLLPVERLQETVPGLRPGTVSSGTVPLSGTLVCSAGSSLSSTGFQESAEMKRVYATFQEEIRPPRYSVSSHSRSLPASAGSYRPPQFRISLAGRAPR